MKVKNIMFSGFMAAILMSATGAADAAISVASKAYVDAKSGAVTTALNEYKTANDAKVDKNAEDIAKNAGSISMVSGALETLTGVVGTKAATTYVDAELAKKVDLTVYNEKMTALGNTDTSLQSQIDAVKALTGETGVAEQIASAVSAEKEAREAADQGLSEDIAANADEIAAINNADTGILKQAQTYADQAKAAAISTAAADATTKADAALAAAKSDAEKYIDANELSESQTAQNTELKAYADQAEADAIATAAADATTKANAAQAAAEATAAADATSKANAAQAAAEQTAASELLSAKTDLENALKTKITAPAACETQDCVLSINKASGTISWTPLTEPVADYLNE